MHPFTRRNPRLQAALERYQATADAQASRWIERQIIGLMRGQQAFGGNEPRITYTRKEQRATMSHGAS
jgi:hypothetical protein